MYRLLYSLVVLFASLYSTFAAPLPLEEGTAENLVERSSQTHKGRGTWFNVGRGNCGLEDTNVDPIVAISKTMYDQNNGGNCNQWIEIKYGGKNVYAKIRDSCQSCGYYDIDMSPATFKGLTSLATGQIEVSWSFMNKSWRP